jgi:hypothetical protein
MTAPSPVTVVPVLRPPAVVRAAAVELLALATASLSRLFIRKPAPCRQGTVEKPDGVVHAAHRGVAPAPTRARWWCSLPTCRHPICMVRRSSRWSGTPAEAAPPSVATTM